MAGRSWTTWCAVLGLGVTLALSPQPARAQSLSDEEVDEAYAFILGNVAFILLHEFGHALVSELSLPVLGREEDAVDGLATVLLLPDDPTPETDQMIIDAMDGWFMTDSLLAEEGEDLIMWDEHGLDLQRAYQVACLIYGSDPEGFSDLADSVDLPEDRRETCLVDWEQTQTSWFSLLAPHVVGQGERGVSVRVVHEAPEAGLEHSAELLRETALLEEFGREVMGQFRLPRSLTIRATSCGEENAYWDPDDAEIVICHELAAFYEHLIVTDIENRSP